MATTAARQRKSKADRAADQAEADRKDQEPQPQPEPGPSDPPDSSGGPSSDTRHKEDQEPQPEPESQPAEPYALVETEAYPQIFYRPSVKICVPGPDGKGETVEVITEPCEHDPSHGGNRWGHKDEKAALTCARKIAAQRGMTVGAPKA